MKTRSFLRASFLRTSLALGVFATTFVRPAPTFARVPPVAQSTAQATAAAVTKAQGLYIKALPSVNGTTGTAQTAIRRFTPLRGNGPSVYLVAAVHIGEKSYYKQIQQFLDKQGVVLYEGVRRSRSAAKTKSVRAAGPPTSSVAEPPVVESPVAKSPVGIQKKLSNALDLQFQMDGIRYDRPQFRNSDLDWETMNALATKAGPETQELLAHLGNSLSGGLNVTRTDQILDQVLRLSASTPFIATMLRRLLVTVLCDPDKIRDLQEKNGTSNSAKQLASILVNQRNKAVLGDLKALLKTSKRNSSRPLRSIALFYGAEHMKNIEQHLISDLGYRPAEVQWITAIQAAH